MFFIRLREFSLLLFFSEFLITGTEFGQKKFFCTDWHGHGMSLACEYGDYIEWFWNIEPTSRPWNKFQLAMMCNF